MSRCDPVARRRVSGLTPAAKMLSFNVLGATPLKARELEKA